jgi:hypothetical protein
MVLNIEKLNDFEEFAEVAVPIAIGMVGALLK